MTLRMPIFLYKKNINTLVALLVIFSCVLVFIWVELGIHGFALKAVPLPGSGNRERLSISPGFDKIPLYFVPNDGRIDKRVLFYARSAGYTLWLTKEGLIFDSARRKETGSGGQYERDISVLMFLNAAPKPQVIPLDTTTHRVYYFKSRNRSTWKQGVSTAGAVLYKNIYKDIDLKVYGMGKQVEYDWILRPGANPADIRFAYKNVKSTGIDSAGNLIIETGFGKLTHKKPLAFQETPSSGFIAAGFKEIGENTYGFSVGNYDKKKELTIDPLVQLDFSNYIGGSEDDFGRDITVDNRGNVYITGYTGSLDFPVKNPCQEKYSGGLSWHTESDVFVTKLSAQGVPVYSTYLGGQHSDEGRSIAVDNKGRVYITGSTKSDDFPTGKASLRFGAGGDSDVFAAKLSADGSAVLYSVLLGGTGYEIGEGIAVDSSGCAYIAGSTDSPGFPTVNPFPGLYGGGLSDVFVCKLSAAGDKLLYSTFVGGTGADAGTGIAVDALGNAYVAGSTGSSDFPTKKPFQEVFAGSDGFDDSDAFVFKLSPAGKTLVYSTYLGGSGSDYCEDIALDANGCAYVTGVTGSGDFPLKNPLQEAPVNYINEVIFVSKLSPTGDSLLYSTYLGTTVESSPAVAVDKAGCAYITGCTWDRDFPVKEPLQDQLSGLCDAFVVKFAPAGSGLLYSTYLGGGGFDQGQAIAVDNRGNVYITGYTDSMDFPTRGVSAGADGDKYKYNQVFAAKLSAGKVKNNIFQQK